MSHTQTLSDSGRTTERRVAHSGLISPPTESTVGLVHDLGNLIQIASSAINIVARNPNINTDDMKFVIAGARTSLERAGALVRQTIGIASQRITTTEQVWVASRLAEIEDLLHSTWDKRIRLDFAPNPNVPPVKCDALALQSAILNLLFNARDAMPNGGVISIRAEAISLGLEDGVELRVIDSGVGMKPETVARAFDPFFTTKSDGLGGVGLPMVERFAREAGGRVLIESEYGVGTTVKLQLPASK